ncbi:MAG: Fe-S cluster assembly protein SufD [Acidimicrobiales bacterium]
MTAFTLAAAAALGGPEWLRSGRVAAAERFASAVLPTEADEIWRYSRISQLDLEAYAPLPADAVRPGIPSEIKAVLAAAGPHSALVVVRDGHVTSVNCDPALAAKGLVVDDLVVGQPALAGNGREALDDGTAAADAFTELNRAFLGAAVVIDVPAGLVVPEPILVLHWIGSDDAAIFPRTVVRCSADSQVTVVEHHGSADVSAFVDPVVHLDVGEAARLQYLNVQVLGPRVFQIGYQSSRVGRDASLSSSVVALGGDYARMRTDSVIDGKGGSTKLNAAYLADGRRMHDFRTLQDHAAPASSSDLLFKGAVQDNARSVYSGLIRVRKEARGTNAFQTNRNLVLSEGASAESVPNLEIETEDVRCSHASAVGPVNEEQRYYLEARGIPPVVAERLIVAGFLGEVLDRLPSTPLVTGIRATLADRLSHTT